MAKQGRYSEARHFHERAAKFDPLKADEAYFNLGLILRAEADYIEALRYFEKAIEIDPAYDDAKTARKDIIELLEIRTAFGKNGARKKKIREI